METSQQHFSNLYEEICQLYGKIQEQENLLSAYNSKINRSEEIRRSQSYYKDALEYFSAEDREYIQSLSTTYQTYRNDILTLSQQKKMAPKNHLNQLDVRISHYKDLIVVFDEELKSYYSRYHEKYQNDSLTYVEFSARFDNNYDIQSEDDIIIQ